MAIINTDSQYKLEQEFKSELAKLGQMIYNLDQAPAGMLFLANELNKKFIEYADNARLLQNQPKEYTSL